MVTVRRFMAEPFRDRLRQVENKRMEFRMNNLVTGEQSPEEQSVKLTKREVEVLTLVIEGKSSKEVAEQLFVSKRTVDFHLANIYEKLRVTNRVQAFREA